MFKRTAPLLIQGRMIRNPLAIELAQHMTEDRALFVAHLRTEREFTHRMIARECSRVWSKDWGERQDIGAALCELSAAFLGEDADYLDTL